MLYNKESQSSDILRLELNGTKVQGLHRLVTLGNRITYFACQGDALVYDESIAYLGHDGSITHVQKVESRYRSCLAVGD